MIELGWIQNPSQAQIMQAIDACPALKSVKIVCCVEDDHLEGLTRAICKKSGLQHLSINDCTLSQRSCLALKSLLGGDCAMKSLDFSSTRVVDTRSVANVTDFAVNHTVRCQMSQVRAQRRFFFITLFKLYWKCSIKSIGKTRDKLHRRDEQYLGAGSN